MSILGCAMLMSGGSRPPIPSMSLWLDATQTPVGALSTWIDFSGNGNSATQGTGALQPVNTANQINGKNAVVFVAASAQRMALPSGLYSLFNSGYTAFCVSQNTGTAAERRMYTASQAGATKAFLNYASGSTISTFGARDTFTGLGSSSFTVTNPAIITVFRSGTTESISINNGTAQTDTSAVSSAGIDGLTLGAASDGSRPMDGLIAEFIIYNQVLSANQIIQTNRYLSNKWGVAIS